MTFVVTTPLSYFLEAILFALIGVGFYLSGYTIADGYNAFSSLVKLLGVFIETNVPTVINITYYPLALAVVFLFSYLPEYLVHRLSHQSRFFWFTFHQVHHIPEIMHPMGGAPAYLFEFFLAIPKVIIMVVVSKLFYAEPMILEVSLYFLFNYTMEIFNHNGAQYEWIHSNKIMRFFCDVTGNGIYHFLHHSSAKEHQMVNLAGGPFCLWDRLFGTYSVPPATQPKVGLTNNPEIVMNPFRVMHGGIARLVYEFIHNKDLKTRFLILFGSIHYCPPVTKEFVKKHTLAAV